MIKKHHPQRNEARSRQMHRRKEELYSMARHLSRCHEEYAHADAPLLRLSDEAEAMERLFGLLDRRWPDYVAALLEVTHFYLLRAAPSDPGKCATAQRMATLTSFLTEIASFADFISEKVYYYEQLAANLPPAQTKGTDADTW